MKWRSSSEVLGVGMQKMLKVLGASPRGGGSRGGRGRGGRGGRGAPLLDHQMHRHAVLASNCATHRRLVSSNKFKLGKN